MLVTLLWRYIHVVQLSLLLCLCVSAASAAMNRPTVAVLQQALAAGNTTSQALEKYRPQLQQVYRDYFNRHQLDAIIFPTTPLTARPIAGSVETVMLNGHQVPTFPTYIHNTDPSSNAGIPGLTLPNGKTPAGMPMGIEIDGPEGSDQRLLAMGAAIEQLILEVAGR